MVKLDDRDRAALLRLQGGEADVDALAEAAECDPDYLRERLPDLADNGLVAAVDGGYRITADGERVLAASGRGTEDDRIDTPPDVERRIESFDLRVDREAAVRNAFAFLHYWGDATRGEIVDAAYSEDPAGYETRDEWWAEGIRDRLADLPSITAPESADGLWRYEGTPTVAEATEDGRLLLDRAVPAWSSARIGVERLDLSEDERAAVRAAFDRLVIDGEVTADELADAVASDERAGDDDPDAWWEEVIEPAFESLRGVEPVGDEGDRWRYRQKETGRGSTDPSADLPDASLAPDDEGED